MFMKVVKGLDPELFAQEFNKVCENFNNPQVQFIDSLTAYVYGEEATPKWEVADPEPEPPHAGRKCAECSYYDWGKSCLAGNGHKYPSDCACEMFYGEYISDEEIEELKKRIKKRAA